MATVTRVLDRARFEARARIGDIVALGLLVVVGFSLMIDMYYLGASATNAAASGGALVYNRDARFVRMLLQSGIVAAALSWVTYRVLSAGARRSGG